MLFYQPVSICGTQSYRGLPAADVSSAALQRDGGGTGDRKGEKERQKEREQMTTRETKRGEDRARWCMTFGCCKRICMTPLRESEKVYFYV